jgi:hypothetical protein
MKYLPGWIAPWKRKAQEWHQRETTMFENFIKDIAADMVRENYSNRLAHSKHVTEFG